MSDNLKERRKKIKKLIEACRKVAGTHQYPELKSQSPLLTPTDPEIKPDAMLGDIGWAMTDELLQFELPRQEKPRYAKIMCQYQWDQLQQYLQSSKCKIPWSNRELEEAKKMAIQEITTIEDAGD